MIFGIHESIVYFLVGFLIGWFACKKKYTGKAIGPKKKEVIPNASQETSLKAT